MPRFEPFPGIHYDIAQSALADVTAPPYDVISPEERTVLAARSRHNIVHVDLPVEAEGRDPYTNAAHLLAEWQSERVLVTDPEPAFYVYGMSYKDERGRSRQTVGIIGALELSKPGEADVLPHERTTPKARSDRLQMLRSCRNNLSAVWGLSLGRGLTALCERAGDPLARWTDDDGVQHRLVPVTDPGLIDAIRESVGAAPVVIADGHHRYSVSLDYRDERRAAAGGAAGPYDAVMTFVVELADDQINVLPIHRLLNGAPPTDELLAALAERFETAEAGPLNGAGTISARMADAGALALVTPGGFWLLRPRAGAFAGVEDLDSSRLDAALSPLSGVELTYQHGVANVVALVEQGRVPAGVLLRPARVDQINAIAHAHQLMPPKTTFFAPKPKTGVVLRALD